MNRLTKKLALLVAVALTVAACGASTTYSPVGSPPGNQPPSANPPGSQPGTAYRPVLEPDLLRMGASVGDGVDGRLFVLAPDEATAQRVRELASQRGVPASALDLHVGRISNFNLRAAVRPVVGGVQIENETAGGICTLGYNATAPAGDGFVTNMHCSSTQGALNPLDNINQHLGAGNRVSTGLETYDPPFFAGAPCPAGFECRRSDASFFRYDPGVQFTRGSIARQAVFGDATAPIVGAWRIVSKLSAGSVPVTQRYIKVGRRTGTTWLQQVWATNATISRGDQDGDGTPELLLGQLVFQAKMLPYPNADGTAGPGDSGSPVFFQIGGTTDVVLVGNLWGGMPSPGPSTPLPVGAIQFIFVSPIWGIEQDFGVTLTVTP
jgi:hypothetical protein